MNIPGRHSCWNRLAQHLKALSRGSVTKQKEEVCTVCTINASDADILRGDVKFKICLNRDKKAHPNLTLCPRLRVSMAKRNRDARKQEKCDFKGRSARLGQAQAELALGLWCLHSLGSRIGTDSRPGDVLLPAPFPARVMWGQVL